MAKSPHVWLFFLSDETHRLDLKSRDLEWVRVADSNVARALHYLVPYKGYLYLIGDSVNIEQYDISTDTWTNVATLPETRSR